jgi:energy-coupling factor transport system permease protein
LRVNATFAYAPRPGPLGSARPAVAAVYLAPLAIIAFTSSNPLVLAAAAAAGLIAAAASDALRAALAPLRFGLYLGLSMIIVNALVSQRGETLLLRGWELPLLGRVDVTAEAIAEGAILALRVLVALLIFAVWSACVDPDRVLRAIRPWAPRSALTASVISRLVPLAASDASRLGEAATLRGPGAAPVGRAAMARRLIAGSLDRSVDVAATLELRGYGLEARPPRSRSRLTREERHLALGGLGLGLVALAASLLGAGGFESYPLVAVDLGPATLLSAAALPALAAAPFLAGRGRRRGRPAPSTGGGAR